MELVLLRRVVLELVNKSKVFDRQIPDTIMCMPWCIPVDTHNSSILMMGCHPEHVHVQGQHNVDGVLVERIQKDLAEDNVIH